MCVCRRKQIFLMVSGFRSVSFTLHSSDVMSTVKNILRSCSLPTDHIMQLKSTPNTSKRPPHQSRSPFYRPATKVDMSYTFSGFMDLEQELQHTKVKEPTLRSGRCTSYLLFNILLNPGQLKTKKSMQLYTVKNIFFMLNELQSVLRGSQYRSKSCCFPH